MKTAIITIAVMAFTLVAFAQEPVELSIGTETPAINAKDYLGKDFSLRGALNEGPVVVVFYRGHWCP
ncbi:MAG: hypothetical protein ACI9FU_001319 [Granulosicoccus sp.]|jgi:hypothetical protein